ncbi:hypothetical protein NDU88_006064 [Pleurodeles waltl]|uniref:Uncharacterized protein n=1 Tax=Pleurodeles waltl TaxID=8319 RepID=A0AAV7N300_PLEWA|nr:hypothetical protein NDU88_006064 [Pleurodeles waltl]
MLGPTHSVIDPLSSDLRMLRVTRTGQVAFEALRFHLPCSVLRVTVGADHYGDEISVLQRTISPRRGQVHVRLPRDAESQYESPLIDPVVGPIQPCMCRRRLRPKRK